MADWGYSVTVCIAAIAGDKQIVTASDTLISFGDVGSADKVSVKMEPFHESWTALMSASDMSQCLPVIEIASENLKKSPSTLRAVTQGFKKAYRQHLAELAASQVLSNFDMDMEEFKNKGAKKFTPDVFSTLSQEIRAVNLDCEFLIYGFDGKKRPHIFAVAPPGVVSIYDKPGFWAIGSGAWAALSMLFSLAQSVDSPFEETVFNVLVSKFMAETPGKVGEHTFLFAKGDDNNRFFSYPIWWESTIRTWWNEHGKPRRDNGIVQQMRESLGEH
jgi:hypothetical protein